MGVSQSLHTKFIPTRFAYVNELRSVIEYTIKTPSAQFNVSVDGKSSLF